MDIKEGYGVTRQTSVVEDDMNKGNVKEANVASVALGMLKLFATCSQLDWAKALINDC